MCIKYKKQSHKYCSRKFYCSPLGECVYLLSESFEKCFLIHFTMASAQLCVHILPPFILTLFRGERARL